MPYEDYIYKDLQTLLEERKWGELVRVLKSMDPADTADFLEDLAPENRDTMFALLDAQTASDIIVELESSYVDDVVEDMEEARIAHLADQMAPDNAARFLNDLDLDDDRQASVLHAMTSSAEVRALMNHEEDTAGHIMTTELCSMAPTATVKEARETLVPMELTDPILFVYVVDPDTDQLIGMVSLQQLFTAKPTDCLNAIMETDYAYCLTDEDQEDVALKFRRYDVWVMPVVDHNNRLVGRITADDIMDVLHEEADEDLAMMVGAPDIEAEEASPFGIARLRLPWLLITMFAGLLNSVIIRHILNVTGVATIAIFVPAIMAMSGNTGIQSSAIAIRGIALGYKTYGRLMRVIWREISVGVFLGLACGLLTGGIIYWVFTYTGIATGGPPPAILATAVGGAMCNAMVFATCYGAVVPIVLGRLDVDPAIASGPFVTTSNDLSASLIYFLTCILLLR
ncbi:MAG: magnesium transporter [Candidatus Pacebacteria bacterium]|nr:magnesium transporter [Candidatus Paceibacterota bacterium]